MKEAYIINGIVCEVIPYGEESNIIFKTYSESCIDCGVKIGEYHKQRCKMEECPSCYNSIMYCKCKFE